MSDPERLKDTLKNLRLSGMLHHLDTTLEQATTKNLDAVDALNLLADIEIEQRWQRSILQRWRGSGLKDKLTMDQFDFGHHRSRSEQKNRILTLLHLDCVSAHSDVLFIGNPGTGKTFLATCMAYAACNANIKVLFTTAMDMINRLIAAEADHSLLKQLNHYYTPDLLVCDELGDLSLGQQGSHLFSQVISLRASYYASPFLLHTTCPYGRYADAVQHGLSPIHCALGKVPNQPDPCCPAKRPTHDLVG